MFKPFNTTSYDNFAGCTSMPAVCTCPENNTAIIMDVTLVMSIFVISLCLVSLIMVIYPIILLVIIIYMFGNIYITNINKLRLKELRCT